MIRSRRRVIVPFFISHQGCPHACVFCDQHTISGSSGALPTPEEIRETVRQYRETSGQTSVEAAFYGGSFTLLPEKEQRRLLEPLQPLLDSGDVSTVRVSTRPDAVDRGTVRLLKELRVSLVELGVQSMDDTVLAVAGRGHTATDTIKAFALLSDTGIAAGGQLMPGLPGESPDGALWSLHQVLALKPACLRIYPTVVLEGTELAARYLRGEYAPLSLADGVTLGARMLHAAFRAGIPVIRMGLQPTDDLGNCGAVVAGPYHPALRHLAESELTCDLLFRLTDGRKGAMSVAAHPSRQAAVAGPNGVNRVRFGERGLLLRRVRQDGTLSPLELAVTIGGATRRGTIVADLTYPGPETYHA